MNVALNEMIHSGLYVNNFEALTTQMMLALAATCQTLIALDAEPEVEDFVHAAAALSNIIRHEMDEALKFEDMENVRISSVMVEIMVKGISTALGLPYPKLLDALAAGATEFKDILISSGHIKGEQV